MAYFILEATKDESFQDNILSIACLVFFPFVLDFGFEENRIFL